MTASTAPTAGTAPGTGAWTALPLFPLGTVLFPGGLLPLRVFEARYLDLVSHCLRSATPFAVVHLRQGPEVRTPGAPDKPQIEQVGVLAQLLDVDAEQPGILRVRCSGGLRVQLGTPWQRDDGLWLADATALPPDADTPVPAELESAAQALARAIDALAGQGQHPFQQPHRLADAGWVANRWCEILPISTAARQRLMVLDEPVLRLQLVHDYLHGKGLL